MSRSRDFSLRTRIAVIGKALCAITRLSLGPAAAEVLARHVHRRLRSQAGRRLRTDVNAAIIRSYSELLGIALEPRSGRPEQPGRREPFTPRKSQQITADSRH